MASGDASCQNERLGKCWTVCEAQQLDLKSRKVILADQILPNTKCSDVKSRFVAYMLAELLPVGSWFAFWRPKAETFAKEILVKVTGLEDNDLRAHVRFQQPSSEDFKMVPLMELTPVYNDYDSCEESIEQLERVCAAIDLIKFFYGNLWRPWDDCDEDDPVFVDHYLGPRLRLYGDIEAGLVSEEVVSKCKSMAAEAEENQTQLEILQNSVNISDSEEEIQETELTQFMRLNLRQEELKREFELMENPAFRLLFHKSKVPVKMAARGKRNGGEAVVHIVGANVQLGMLQNLELASTTIVRLHDTIGSALEACYDGDTVLVFPGVYRCDAIGWFDETITIQGICESADEVVWEAGSGSDIFIYCDANKVQMSNLTLKPSPSMMYTIMVHYGETVLKNCKVLGASEAVNVCGGGHLTAEDCLIEGSKNYGIRLRDGASANLSNVTVNNCSQGICVQGSEISDEDGSFCPVDLNNCTISKCDRYDVLVMEGENLSSCTNTYTGEQLQEKFHGKLPLVSLSNVKFPDKPTANIAVATCDP